MASARLCRSIARGPAAGDELGHGADLEAARAGLATSPLWEELSGAIASAPALTIAALNGTAAGGALGMVLACDLRIAAPRPIVIASTTRSFHGRFRTNNARPKAIAPISIGTRCAPPVAR